MAPRPFFVNAPRHVSHFRSWGVDECAKAARPVYELLGDQGNLIIKHPDCGHDFLDELREGAYTTIDSVLRPESK